MRVEIIDKWSHGYQYNTSIICSVNKPHTYPSTPPPKKALLKLLQSTLYSIVSLILKILSCGIPVTNPFGGDFQRHKRHTGRKFQWKLMGTGHLTPIYAFKNRPLWSVFFVFYKYHQLPYKICLKISWSALKAIDIVEYGMQYIGVKNMQLCNLRLSFQYSWWHLLKKKKRYCAQCAFNIWCHIYTSHFLQKVSTCTAEKQRKVFKASQI